MENLASLSFKLQGKSCVSCRDFVQKIWFLGPGNFSSDTVSIPDCGVLAGSRAFEGDILVKLATDTWTLAATFHFDLHEKDGLGQIKTRLSWLAP